MRRFLLQKGRNFLVHERVPANILTRAIPCQNAAPQPSRAAVREKFSIFFGQKFGLGPSEGEDRNKRGTKNRRLSKAAIFGPARFAFYRIGVARPSAARTVQTQSGGQKIAAYQSGDFWSGVSCWQPCTDQKSVKIDQNQPEWSPGLVPVGFGRFLVNS